MKYAPFRRLVHIDVLRAIAILAMILAHVLSYNLGSPAINRAWNYTHFAVVLFVFCSGYLFYRQYETAAWSSRSLLTWIRKRTTRLLPQYYAFLVIHYALWFLLPNWFSGLGLQKSLQFISASALLIGVDYGWLPLLFLELMVVSPLLLILFRSAMSRRLTAIFLTGFTTLLFAFPTQIDYRIMMWIPWSLIIFLSFAFAYIDTHHPATAPRHILRYGIASGFLYILGAYLLTSTHTPLTLTVHKYPPDMWFFSYGVTISAVLLLLARSFMENEGTFGKFLTWISQHSYSLFFVHYIVIDALQTWQRAATVFPVWLQILLSAGGSVGVLFLYQQLTKRSVRASGATVR